MNKKTGWKAPALSAVLAMSLALTACYVPADEVTVDDDINLNNQNLPWQTVSTVTSTPAPTAVPLITNPPQQYTSPQEQQTFMLSTATPTIGSYSVVTGVPQAAATPTLKPVVPTATVFLYKKGSSGSTVKTIQQRLKDLGYYTGHIDGSFGASTETAVKNFQKTNGLTADGAVGSTTYAKLTSSSAMRAGSTPSPKAITTLKQGSTGSSVRTVQQRLKALGYYSGTVDGKYGATTTTAVKAFQRKNGLYADGKVGTTTWARLNSSSAISAKGGATATPASSTVLKVGSSGSAVKSVQSRLKTLGYYSGTVDGIYGSTTESAVKAFQKRNGLTADGTVGSATLTRLNSSSAKAAAGVTTHPTATATARATVTPRPSTIVAQPGDNNDTVKAFQNRLKELGYFSASSTGYYGSVTEDAVKRFQKANGLNANGIITTFTQKILNSASAKPAGGATAKPTATPMSSDTVKTVQQRLLDLGYFSGKVTGNYGSVTTAAMKEFQKANGLSQTGTCDKTTYDLLMSSKAKARTTATPKPTATPNTSIIARKGDSSALVTTIQNRLKELGYFHDSVTQYYGTKTVDAVKAFQKANKLSDTGTCDQSTYNLLMSSKARSVGTATPKPTATPNGSIIARKGDKNAIVTQIQSRLIELGYLSGKADGNYGTSTVSAVKDLQTANKLSATGTCDQSTYNLLMSSKVKAKATATPKPTATPNANIIAKKGDKNAIVTQIQSRLIELGYFSENADGSYGTATAASVKAFQTANSIAATGTCDQSTYNLLMSSKAKAKATATPKPTATPDPDIIAGPGASSGLVESIQLRLKELGYFSGTATGNYGSKTKEAVIAFQKRNNLPETGSCDKKTYNLLVSEKAKPNGTATPVPTATPNTTIIAKRGDSGSVVEEIQNVLIIQGYLNASATGNYGSMTESAVKDFQKVNGLASTGICDQSTYKLLMSGKGKPKYTATPKPTATPNGTIIAKKGDNGSVVTAIQNNLIEQGYLTTSATGNYGSMTASAVKEFQTANGLAATGTCDQTTYKLLMSGKGKAKVTATPKATSTPRTDLYLEEGKSGTNVRHLQSRLIELGYLSGQTTASYSGSTVAAVRAFQKRAGLYVDGIAGPSTLEAIYSSNAKKAGSVAALIGITLKSGDQGSDVTVLQKRLKELGYLTSSANGSYGEMTATAVQLLQQKNGLKVTGIANPATLNVLFHPDTLSFADGLKHLSTDDSEEEKVVVTGKSVSADSAAITVGEYKTLRSGASGSAVTRLQQALHDQGYLKIKPTGSYAGKTTAAVKAFQSAYGLRATGVAGPATQRILFGTSYEGASSSLKEGSNGTDVSELQYTLYELGFYDGKINGIYGQSTVDAVAAFQKANGISPANGQTGSKTRTKLYSASPVGAN